MANNLSNQIKTTRSIDATAAGTSDINGGSVDMSNFEGARFIVGFGAIVAGAATSVKIQTSSDNSAWNDLAGTAVTVADDDDNKVVILDIYRPRERYLRPVVLRATQNAVVDFALVEQYLPNILPTTDTAADLVAREIHTSPAEGTA